MSNTDRNLTIHEVASALGLSVVAVRNYVRRGAPHSGNAKRTRFNLSEVREWQAANGLTGKPGRPVLSGDEDLDELRRQKEAELVAHYRLRNQQARRQLIPVEQVELLGAEACRVLSHRLQGFPAAITARLEGRAPHEVVQIIEDGLRVIVADFARDIESLPARVVTATEDLGDEDATEPTDPPAKTSPRKAGPHK